MTAQATGFSEQLVVKNAQAAANPALASVRFGVTTQGLSLSKDAAGNLSARDSAGGTVFRAPVPMMWDTATQTAAPNVGTADGSAPDDPSVPGEHTAPLGVQVDQASLVLTPDQSILTGADTVFPVVVDPSWNYGLSAWTEVNAEDPNSATWRTVPSALAAGFQDFESPWSRVRTFVRFPLDSRIYGTKILSASLNLFENWSSSCTARSVQVFDTGGFGSSTTWNNQPTWGVLQEAKNAAYGHDSGCPAHGVEFNVQFGVAEAAKNRTGITFGIKASDENDHLGWKKFNTNPTVTVVYDRPPATPGTSTMSTTVPNTSCVTSKALAPHTNVTPASGITLRVKVADPDGDKVRVAFDFRKDAATTPLAAPVSSPMLSGSVVPATVVKNQALTNGALYAWRAQEQDVNGTGQVVSTSAWSAWCYLSQDSTAPSEPVVTSTDYPSDAYAGGAGQDGEFDFAPGSTTDTDITSYCYGIDQPGAPNCTSAEADHTLSVLDQPPSYGPHNMWVKAKDAAGNSSTAVAYQFYANAASDAVAHWTLDDGEGTTANGTVDTDPDRLGPTATLSPTGVTWTPSGKVGGAATFDGASGSISAADARVDTSKSFTVTAWVRLTSKADFATAVSQDGVRESGFYLQYSATDDRWGMAMQSADADTVSTIRAVSSTSPQLNIWTHLAGVYDLSAHQLRLYVNGVQAGTATDTTPWDATGTLKIGRALSRGSLSNFWTGDVDDVRVYDRALTDKQIDEIINRDSAATPAGRWSFDEASGTTAADTSGHNHDVTLGSGAAFVPDGHDGGGLSLDGVTSSASTADTVVRTDQSFSVSAWVRLSDDFDGQTVATIASQDGTNTSGFVLQYLPEGLWSFSMPQDDAADSTPSKAAQVPVHDSAGAWVQVVGSYDAFSHTPQISVSDSFGTFVQYGAQATPWNAAGQLQVGRDRTTDDNGDAAYQDQFPGVIDDLMVTSSFSDLGAATARVGDVLGVEANGTSGRVEVHGLSSADDYHSYTVHVATALPAADLGRWSFGFGKYDSDSIPDLYAVDTQDNGGANTTLHVYSGVTNYQAEILTKQLPSVGATSLTRWQYTTGDYDGDGRTDLIMVDTQDPGGTNTAVHVLSAASNFGTYVLHRLTPQIITSVSQYRFTAGDYDGDHKAGLIMVDTRDSGNTATAAHVLSASSGYATWVLHKKMPLPATDPAVWQFGTTDRDGDGKADFLAINGNDPSWGRTVVDVLTAASQFGTVREGRVTPMLPTARSDWQFSGWNGV